MKLKIKPIILIFFLILLSTSLIIFCYFALRTTKTKLVQEVKTPPQGLMILIESTDKPTGLLDMVAQMKEKNIYGLLMITPEFVNANCEAVKKSLSYGNVEIVASNVGSPFWDVPYEEQKTRITEMLDGIENCTSVRPRIISSRYMASDMNTIKVA